MRKILPALITALILSGGSSTRDVLAQRAEPPADAPSQARRRFTVADDIGFEYFGDPFYAGSLDPVSFSPDERYFVVATQRGRLDFNRPETTLRVFRTEDAKAFLKHPEVTGDLSTVWSFALSTNKNGPIATQIRWLADSSGIAFLVKTKSGNHQLILADLKTKKFQSLTPEDQDVTAFDIRDRNHLVYTALSPVIQHRVDSEARAVSIVGTGRSLYGLLFPADIRSEMEEFDRNELWAVVAGRRIRVQDKSSGRPLTVYSAGTKALALAPDARSVVTALPVEMIPREWEILFPPALPFLRDRIRFGKQDLDALSGFAYASEYVLIDLPSQHLIKLTNAPIADILGWSGPVQAVWSTDSKAIALPNTFVGPRALDVDQQTNRPCVAVFDIGKDAATCLGRPREQSESAFDQEPAITSVRFSPNDSQRVFIDYRLPDGSVKGRRYDRSNDSSWTVRSGQTKADTRGRPIGVFVRQSLNDPPVLIARDIETEIARVILDPNPQLKGIDLGEASRYEWKDQAGRNFTGGLYKPPGFVQGRRYPLVIQTHGFVENKFIPSGLYPSAFAARALAGAGIMVLQISDISNCLPYVVTPEEGPCAVAGYEAAVEQLVRDGLANQDFIGIVGFSRTSYYVLQALTTSRLHFKAASITDGMNAGYFQYLSYVDLNRKANAHGVEGVIGAAPFGEGLQKWMRRSPEFNIEKVSAPLQVVALNRASALLVWGPYAGLRALSKPVDLLVLPEGKHLLSNPAERMASQGGTVDWFRFWLKGEEDPDPAKVEQYARWRDLRKLQAQNGHKLSNTHQTGSVESRLLPVESSCIFTRACSFISLVSRICGIPGTL